MTALPEQRCNRCRFWLERMEHRDPNDADWGFGSCRRRAPALSDAMIAAVMPRPAFGESVDPDLRPLDLIPASLFPATHSADWCGEFRKVKL